MAAIQGNRGTAGLEACSVHGCSMIGIMPEDHARQGSFEPFRGNPMDAAVVAFGGLLQKSKDLLAFVAARKPPEGPEASEPSSAQAGIAGFHERAFRTRGFRSGRRGVPACLKSGIRLMFMAAGGLARGRGSALDGAVRLWKSLDRPRSGGFGGEAGQAALGGGREVRRGVEGEVFD